MVETNGLCKEFRDKTGVKRAVDNVSFLAREGEIFGLLGVNGAGKTTTLRILSTVIRATAGSATVNGYDVVKDSEKVRASIGFMSTSTALYGRLTGKETLEYFGKLYGLSSGRIAERIAFVTEKLNLSEFIGKLCDTLSTGQKQRVNIARTILHDPAVLFLDEPTSGLDIVTSQAVMEFIEDSRAQGKTIVFSSHIMSEAERLCDRIAIIHDGHIGAEGTLAELKASTESETLEQAFLKIVKYERELSLA